AFAGVAEASTSTFQTVGEQAIQAAEKLDEVFGKLSGKSGGGGAEAGGGLAQPVKEAASAAIEYAGWIEKGVEWALKLKEHWTAIKAIATGGVSTGAIAGTAAIAGG